MPNTHCFICNKQHQDRSIFSHLLSREHKVNYINQIMPRSKSTPKKNYFQVLVDEMEHSPIQNEERISKRKRYIQLDAKDPELNYKTPSDEEYDKRRKRLIAHETLSSSSESSSSESSTSESEDGEIKRPSKRIKYEEKGAKRYKSSSEEETPKRKKVKLGYLGWKKSLKEKENNKNANDDLVTPEVIWNDLKREFGELDDPCPINGKSLAEDPMKDGLLREWGNVTYCFPPFNDLERWLGKAVEEYKKGKTVIVLIPANTSTQYFTKFIAPFYYELRFICGKLKFTKGTDNTQKHLPHNLCLAVLKPGQGAGENRMIKGEVVYCVAK